MDKHYKDIAVIQRRKNMAERLLMPFQQLNYLTNGILFGTVFLIMAPTNVGKTVLTRMITECVIKQGYKEFIMWGEDDEQTATEQLYTNHIPYNKTNYEHETYKNDKTNMCWEYRLTQEKFDEAAQFFAGKLFVYDNNVTPTKENILAELEACFVNEQCRVFILDNLEILDLDNLDENKGVKEIMVALRRWAISHNAVIGLVSHIKKIERDVIIPDIFDNKGTSSVTNVCRNIFTLIRTDYINKNLKAYKQLEEEVTNAGYNIENCAGILKVLKSKGRGLGYVGLGFNKYTNSYYELPRTEKQDTKKDEQEFFKKPTSIQQQFLDNKVCEALEKVPDIFDTVDDSDMPF